MDMSIANATRGWIVKGLLSLGVLAVLSLSLNSLVFSSASLTAPGATGYASFTAGALGHLNSQNGRLVIDAGGLVPGDSVSGAMVLTGTGDVPGSYTLSASGLTDTSTSPRLADTLVLSIRDTTAGRTLYDGAASGFSSVALGSISPGESHGYSVTLTYPDGTNDSRLQGATMVLGLRVVGVSS
jgi:hypothetical protein